jgi:hypothetical protein
MIQFIATRPRTFLLSAVLDIVDAHPVLALALIVAGCAGTLAIAVLA